ncbi:MAG: hypothetical protein HYV96_04055 [Opitutae bacterium]|nr:hypothetical protein [Opitutae bacterium]
MSDCSPITAATAVPLEIRHPAVIVWSALFGSVAVLAAWLARDTGLGVFRAFALVPLWAAVVALPAALPRRLPWKLRPALVAAFAVAVLGWLWWPRTGFALGATTARLQLAAALFAVVTFAGYFLASYSSHALRETSHTALARLAPLGRLVGAAAAVLVGALLAWLYFRLAWIGVAERAFVGVVLVLGVEAALRALFRFYQPPQLRAASPAAFGDSVLLPALFGEAGPFRSLVASLERNFGLRLADAWLWQLARAAAAPLALLFLVGLWLSTAVTRVPVDAAGVAIVNGAFQPQALPPGLHFHAPWPWGRIVAVPTRVREISLGFERDLAGPVLWAEKHFEGEQNLLVGNGQELLTVNVPIHFRVRDAVASLRRTSDPAAALTALGSRALIDLAAEHDAFSLMTTERAALAAQLHARLQAASDRLGFGLEIVFVGLKDVHPPVPVAPAYQDVVSAEEERSALVDEARRHAIDTLGAARTEATRLRAAADAAAIARRAQAAGETVRFLAPLDTWREHRTLFAFRLRAEATETAFARARALHLVPAGAARRTLLLGFDSAAAPAASLEPKP